MCAVHTNENPEIIFKIESFPIVDVNLCSANIYICSVYHTIYIYFYFTLFYLDPIYLPLLSCVLYQALLQYFMIYTLRCESRPNLLYSVFDLTEKLLLVLLPLPRPATDAVISNQILELF